MGKSAIPHLQRLLFFLLFFFGRKMQVALLFLLVIIASVQLGNACCRKGDEICPTFAPPERFIREIHTGEKRMKNPRYSQEKHGRGQEKRQKEAIGLFKSLLTEAKRLAKNEDTNKIHVTENKEILA